MTESRLYAIEDDIKEIKESLKKLVEAYTELALHNQRLTTLEQGLYGLNKDVRRIQETCLLRGATLERLSEGPQDWWERNFSSAGVKLLWLVLGGVVGTLITRYVR